MEMTVIFYFMIVSEIDTDDCDRPWCLYFAKKLYFAKANNSKGELKGASN